MPSLLRKAKQRWRGKKTDDADCPVSTLPLENPAAAQRSVKSPEASSGGGGGASISSGPAADSSSISIETEPSNSSSSSSSSSLWTRAEQKLGDDERTKHIWKAYLEGLESELGSGGIRPSGDVVGWQAQVYELLDAKTKELEEKSWKVHFGDHTVEVRELLTRTFRNVLAAKEIIVGSAGGGVGASSLLPAARACAGAAVILSLLVQAAGQRAVLFRSLDAVSALTCRLHVTEKVYRSRARVASIPSEQAVDLEAKFEANLCALYSQILEFQARALCYLRYHPVVRLYNDVFKDNVWDRLLKDMKESEDSVRNFTTLIDGEQLHRGIEKLQKTLDKCRTWQRNSDRDEKAKKCLQTLYTCPYKVRKDRNKERVPGTCEWFTGHPRFRTWAESETSSVLWVSAEPGCGKSVLAKYLIDEVLPSTRNRTTCYFFFKDDFADQRSATGAICALLRQLLLEKPALLRDSILEKLETDGDNFTQSFRDLWSTLVSVATDNRSAGEVVCILDALDECQSCDLFPLIRALGSLRDAHLSASKLKFLVTSRPYGNIREEFKELESRTPIIHLSGEDEARIEEISHEINLVIRGEIDAISRKKSLQPDERTFLQEQLTSVPNRTYLWVTLVLDVIKNTSGFTRGNVRRTIGRIPDTVDKAYERILDRSSDVEKAKRLLHIVTAAVRPLSVEEMSLALAIQEHHRSYDDVMEELEPEERFRHTVRDLCGLFVVIIDSKIYLLHQTAKEFLVQTQSSGSLLEDPSRPDSQFKWKHALRPVESNRILVERCIWYLSSDFVEKNRVLLDYSAINWIAHFRDVGIRSEEAITELARNLCDMGSKRYKAWVTVYEREAHFAWYLYGARRFEGRRRSDAAVVRCRVWARGGREAAAWDWQSGHGFEGQKWSDAAVVCCDAGAWGNREAADRYRQDGRRLEEQ
ncbi:hypothetical protein GP486_007365 [Trichoglossum hirsutum]|uniref:NWD NACHT-NTPase N-terminal domain-containing protein n=1 Tax=Trichoglossum hirsutum TaxID=265104 RepID=A0A9P8IFY0_9PEZI|nr:hypothetical protein GP486_007365 [Trichoglossum hirsutum]